MYYYLDTEFYERGYARIDLISVALVAEDGRELYAVASDGWDEDEIRATSDGWLVANVLPHLEPRGARVNRLSIRDSILAFVDNDPSFVGYYADYDWVLLAQLFGRMVDLPKGWPMYCLDLKQMAGKRRLPKQEGVQHNALADARWIRDMHRMLLTEPA